MAEIPQDASEVINGSAVPAMEPAPIAVDVEMKDEPVPEAPPTATPAAPVPSRPLTPAPRQSPQSSAVAPPSQPNPHGSPVRVYLNQKVTPHLLDAMKRVAVEEPEKPLLWLSEYLAKRSREVEG